MIEQPIEIDIDEVVVDSPTMIDRARLGETLRAELSRLLSAPGTPSLWRRGLALDSLDGGDIQLDTGPVDAARTGARLARAIYSAVAESAAG
jgi:hypothetical protein